MELINQVGALLGLTTLVLGAGVYLYGTGKRGRADVIRQDNNDLRASNQELRAEKSGYIATVTQQADTIKNLREVATQTPAVTQLLDMSQKQQAITAKQHSDVIKQLSQLTGQMSELTKEFSKVAQAMQKNTAAQDLNTASNKRRSDA